MIFARLNYKQHYSDVHFDLDSLIRKNFTNVESGLQGDSWIWILENNEKVAIDSFTSMKHEIKSEHECQLVAKVIDILSQRYSVEKIEYKTKESLNNPKVLR